jgi:hypothetical protein
MNRVFSEFFSFPLPVSFHQCSILIFIYMLLLPEGQRAKPGYLPKSSVLLEIANIG